MIRSAADSRFHCTSSGIFHMLLGQTLRRHEVLGFAVQELQTTIQQSSCPFQNGYFHIDAQHEAWQGLRPDASLRA